MLKYPLVNGQQIDCFIEWNRCNIGFVSFLCRTLSYLGGLPRDTAPFCFLQNLPSLQKLDVLGFVEDEEYLFVTSHLHKSVHVK